MTRVSPLLLETAATSVRRAADMSSPFALPPPCVPTPVPAPSHVSLQTHHIPTRHSCTLARSRSTNPCMEAAGGARQPICMYIPHTRAQMKQICRSNSNEFVLGRYASPRHRLRAVGARTLALWPCGVYGTRCEDYGWRLCVKCGWSTLSPFGSANHSAR